MNFLTFLCLVWSFTWTIQAEAIYSEAMAECGNLHHIEFHNLPNAEALFSNDNCLLKCTVGNMTLSSDNMNEGFACPKNPNGICHNGQCVLTPHPNNDALRECGNIHHIEFLKENTTGTLYSDSQCFLRCVIKGNTISNNTINEGFPCPENHNGICRIGHCVIESKGTSQPSTVPPPSTVHNQQPTISPPISSTHKIDQLDLTFQYAHLFNGSHFKVYATACVEETISNNTTLHCKHQCSTKSILLMTDRPLWSESCGVKGPFTEKDNLLIRVRYEGEHDIGGFTKPIVSLFDRHYHSQHFKTIPGAFVKEEKFEIVNQDNNQVVGEIDLAFRYWISHK